MIRQRSEHDIVEGIRWLHQTYGYTGFMFYDDELNVSKSFVNLMNEIHKLQQELGVEFRLRGFVKAELFTEQQAEAMYKAGFRWILSGFEAAHPQWQWLAQHQFVGVGLRLPDAVHLSIYQVN